MSAAESVTLAEVQRAARALEGRIVRTPCTRSQVLSRITGAEVWLKFENFQFTASFKERGALNKLLSLSAAERAVGVAAMSAGNHAQGVAYHGAQLGLAVAIVMPRSTPFTKVQNTRALGAEVILHGETLAEAQAFLMEELIGRRGMTLVHPFDDPYVIAGQGTVALEMLESVPELEMLVLPVGGGGLAAGCAVVAQGMKPWVRVVGVESAGYASAWAEMQENVMPVLGGQTIAEGIAVAKIGNLPMAILREHGATFVQVPEPLLERAVAMLATIEKVVSEGAGGAGLAALLAEPAQFAARKVGLVVSGGNIDPRLLASVLLRQLVHESRLVKFSIDIEDRPGFLGRVATRIGDSGGNIVEVHHERLRAGTHARSATVEILIEVQEERHAVQILADLQAAGFSVHLMQESVIP